MARHAKNKIIGILTQPFQPQADHPLLVGVVHWNLSINILLFIEEMQVNDMVATICCNMQNLKQIIQ